MRYVKANDQSGKWDVLENDACWLAEFESESMAHEFANAPMVKEEFLRLLHLAETPGDFSKKEESDILLEASTLASKLEVLP